MTSGRLSPASASVATIVIEALDKVASPAARDAIVSDALAGGGDGAVPDDPDRLSKFVSGPLCDATAKLLGSAAADAILEDLEPLLRLAATQARRRASRHPSGTLVPPAVKIHSAALPIIKGYDDPADADAGGPTPRHTFPYGKSVDSLVLVVDDDAPFLGGLTRMLRIEGHDVVTAPHGAAALRLCRRLRPRLVVTDLEMPAPDGAELARLILQSTGGATKVVLLTGAANPPTSLEGVDAILKKSVRPQELMRTLASLLASLLASELVTEAGTDESIAG